MSKTTKKKRPLVDGDIPLVPTLRLVYSGEKVLRPAVRHEIRRGATEIGREVKGGLLLPEDESLSRRHAMLHCGAARGELRIEDLGSTNGIFVNGDRVSDAALADGDVLGLGDLYFVCRLEPADLSDGTVDEIVGCSPATQELRAAIEQAAPEKVSVLLLGPPGTGKEVTARAIHRLSGRSGAFVEVNCSAIPAELAESQLFGHVPGAFTGARAASEGLFRTAKGGTLFLDEIGDLPLSLQPKLLRTLQEHSVLPVGAATPVPVDVRIVAATNRDLDQAIANGAFRLDLHSRLNGFPMHLPPLRARREDILLLVLHALGEDCRQITPALAHALLLHDWQANVRDVLSLTNLLRIRSKGAPVLDLPLVADRFRRAQPAQQPAPEVEPEAEAVEAGGPMAIPTREQLIALLIAHQGVVADVARIVRRSRKQVYRWIRDHEIDLDSLRPAPPE